MSVERVRVAELKVAAAPAQLKIFGLGSCVALALFDPKRGLGGLAHILLPGPAPMDGDGRAGGCKFADRAVPALLAAMREKGSRAEDLEACIIGGANMFMGSESGDDGAPAKSSVGGRNIEAVRGLIEALAIKVRAEDVGGNLGRTITFDPGSGEVVITNYKGDRRVL